MLPWGRVGRGLFVAAGMLLLTDVAQATGGSSPVGSTNVTVADPGVPRPPGRPCVVQLFSNDSFTDYSQHPFAYTPPKGCGTRWSKVVLEADFSVSAGIQYDRTATIFLGGVNLYFGTTQEPDKTEAQSWHVERDLTDYTALFGKSGQGQAFIGNIVNSTYTGVISGSAKLLFYPVTVAAPAAKVPDAVYPLGTDTIGSTTALDSSTNQLSGSFTLPRNVERAYLDVFTQSQSSDEFWYTCVPDQYASETEECGGGNFREAEITIDGQAAGVAPVYPWIYTGGIDLFMWEPTPGVQTLNFVPYRVDLTPFAGLLSNGATHTVAVSVQGADNYFSTAASLLVYEDSGSRQTSGGILQNTLASQPPTPTIGSTLQQDSSGNVTGAVTTQLSRHFTIQGYVNTSHGRVVTTVEQTVAFKDQQIFNITSSAYGQDSVQLTTVDGSSRSLTGGLISGQFEQHYSYPLDVNVVENFASDGSLSIPTTVKQGYSQSSKLSIDGLTLYAAQVQNQVNAADTLALNASYEITGHSGQSNTQTFAFTDSLGDCYKASVSTANDTVTAYSSGKGCPGGQNRTLWFTHPDGSPYTVSTLPNW